MNERIELKEKRTQTPIIGLLDRDNKKVLRKSINNANQKEYYLLIYNTEKKVH